MGEAEDEGKWFAAAKQAGLFNEAIALAQCSPCAPQTLARAARDFAEQNPPFALEAGMAALHWLVEGFGYDVTAGDVLDVYTHTLAAAKRLGCAETTRQRLRDLVATERGGDCAAQYAVAVYTTSAARHRERAVLAAFDAVAGVWSFAAPLRELEQAAVEPLSGFSEFLL